MWQLICHQQETFSLDPLQTSRDRSALYNTALHSIGIQNSNPHRTGLLSSTEPQSQYCSQQQPSTCKTIMALIIQEALHAIPVVEFCILLLLNLLPSYSTADGVKQGHFHEAFFIRATSLNELAVIEKVKTRSLVQCCTKCDVSYIYKGCSGVAYRDGECNIFYGTALGSFVQGNGTGDDFKVMINDAQQVQQVGKSFILLSRRGPTQ